MILRSIKLNNVRSYRNQEITFPDGNVLLAGDIGAGKSTILLAIEFALFGLVKGHISGTALLRHGKQEGSVELAISVGKDDVVIKRTLKRLKAGVQQNSGYIIYKDRKKEGTATELKSQIFEIMGYPKETVSKKNMLFRYTVYTPQEEMKQIILEDKEVRLEILRKLFGIDKYRRIRENCLMYIRKLKESQKELLGRTIDLDEKLKQRHDLIKRQEEIGKMAGDIKPQILAIKEELILMTQEMSLYEQQIKDLAEIKKQEAIATLSIRNYVEKRNENQKMIEEIEKTAKATEAEIEKEGIITAENIKEELKELEKTLKEQRDMAEESTKALAKIKAMIEVSKKIKDKITLLDECPTCMQKVREDYKEEVIIREEKAISESTIKIDAFSERIHEAKKSEEKIRKDMEQLRLIERRIEINLLKKKTLEESKRRAIALDIQQEELKKKIGEENSKKIMLNRKAEELKESENKHAQIRKAIESKNDVLRKIESSSAALDREHELNQKMIALLEAEILKKNEAKEKISQLSETQVWLEEYFINLMAVMEKHILARVHSEFNSLFEKWFGMLIEDENMTARIDDEFSPVITQNGYETELENLSGGEKTACALAYRLCLNRVVNDIMSSIKTKDIIILDEPTDGFSAQQLDKVRDVLEELSMKQVVIVSHEPKIESFVDRVIRVAKTEHVSGVF